MKLLILLQIVFLTAVNLSKSENVPNGTIFHKNVRMEMSVRQVNNNSKTNGSESAEISNSNREDSTDYEGNDLDFDYDQEEDVLDVKDEEDNSPERQMQEALLKAMRKPQIRKQIGEVIPILRVMSPAQRLTLAALISSQIMSQNTLSESNLAEIASMFAGKSLESPQERNNVTEYLLLPISMDIAKMFRGLGREVGRNLRQNFYNVRKSEATAQKLRRRRVRKPSSKPLPPPIQPTVKRRIDDADYYIFEEDLRHGPANKTYTEIFRQPGKEDCDYFTKSLCLEVANYPTEAIISSLRKNADIAKTFLADFDVQPNDESSPSSRRNRIRSRQLKRFESFERRQDDGNEITNGGAEENNFMCPSAVKYARPKRARTTSGVWKYIVNAGDYTQTLRLEMCMKPKAPCSYVTNHLNSECTQVFNYHRLLTWDENQGLHMDVFKVPSCCSCHIQGYSNFYPPNKDFSFADKRREPVTATSDIPLPPPPPPLPAPVQENPIFQVQNSGNNIVEVPNVIPLGNIPLPPSKPQGSQIIYQPNLREFPKNPAEHLVPPGPPLPLENEANFHLTHEPKFYSKKGPFDLNAAPQNLRYSTVTEPSRATNRATERVEFGTNPNVIPVSQTRFSTPGTAHIPQTPNVVISQTHHQVVLPTTHFEANAVFEQDGQIRYVIPLVNSPLPLSNPETKKVKPKEAFFTPPSPPTNPPNRDYGYQNSIKTNLRPPPQYYSREYQDNKGVPSRLSPLYVTPPKEIIATTTTTTATTTTTTTPAPKKSEIITASGQKKVNYNYHPIIDFFRPETSKKKPAVYSVPHNVASQDWTPVLGQ